MFFLFTFSYLFSISIRILKTYILGSSFNHYSYTKPLIQAEEASFMEDLSDAYSYMEQQIWWVVFHILLFIKTGGYIV